MNDPIPDLTLKDGEVALQSWRPQLRIFLRKLAFVGGLTSLVFGGVYFPDSALEWALTVLTLPLSAMLYVFLFDDYQEWFKRRNDIWTLTNLRLLYLNTDQSMEPSQFYLSEIKRIKGWMWWTLRVKLVDGRAFRIDYLPDRKLACAAILSARDLGTGRR